MKSTTIPAFEKAVQGYIDKNKDSLNKTYKLFGKSGMQRAKDILAKLPQIDSYNKLIGMIIENNTGTELIGILKECAIKEFSSQEQINKEAQNYTHNGKLVGIKHPQWIPPVGVLDESAQKQAKDAIFKKMLDGTHETALLEMKKPA